MPTSVTLNTYNLQDSDIRTEKVNHESVNVEQSKVKIPHRDGEKLVSYVYGNRNIPIEGTIKSTTESGLDGKIDDLKKNVIGLMDVNLDVGYIGGTRRFKVNVERVVVTRAHYNTTIAPFRIDCEAINPPFGMDTTSISGYASTTISGSFVLSTSGMLTNDSFTIQGTAKPKPNIRFIVNVAGSMTGLQFTNLTTNTSILIAPISPSNGDIYDIDTENYLVKKNGVEVTTYSGLFPTFNVGVNQFSVNVFGTNPNSTVGLAISYTRWYL